MIPAERLLVESDLLRNCQCAAVGRVEIRKVDKLSTVRVAFGALLGPHRLVGRHVEVVTHDARVRIDGPGGDVVAEHVQLAAGEASVLDEHYRRHAARLAGPAHARMPSVSSASGEPAEAFIRQGAAAGVAYNEQRNHRDRHRSAPRPRLSRRHQSHRTSSQVRPVPSWRCPLDPRDRPSRTRTIRPGTSVVVGLPSSEVRSLDAYRIENLG